MLDDVYKRQETLELNKNIKVGILGIGGIGYNFALQLAMSGVKDIYMFDADVIESSNLNRLPVPMTFIGKNKAVCAKLMIEQMRTDTNIMAFPYNFSEKFLPSEPLDWMVDCTDVYSTQLENEKIAKARGMKYMKIGYDGERIGIHNSIGKWGTGEETDGYTVTPSWVVPAAMVAGLAVAKIMKYPTYELGDYIYNFFTRKG